MNLICHGISKRTLTSVLVAGLFCLLPQIGFAEGIPALKILEGNDGGTEYSLSLQLIIVMTLLGLLPSILILMTSFTRIIIVLSLLRQAMGTAQTPPNQVLIAIALFLSLFIMTPTLTAVYDEAVNPYVDQEIAAEEESRDLMQTVEELNLTVHQQREENVKLSQDHQEEIREAETRLRLLQSEKEKTEELVRVLEDTLVSAKKQMEQDLSEL